MKKVLVLILLTIAFSTDSFAQRKWKDEYYQTLNDDNFRDFKLFNKSLDLKRVDYKVLNAAVFFVTNEARIEQGLQILAYQPNLEIMAWNHSISMAKKDFFDHINKKERKRKSPINRAKLAGIRNPNIGENISAVGGRSFGSYLQLADHLVQGWIDSPPHRKTLYSKNALQLACGVYYFNGLWQKNRDVYKQGNGFWLATQNFQMFTKVESGASKDKGPK
ncbi:CAP domain-containing protein [Roseivirga sp. E12]|uniref:CAP domain-containing protein n=1 Tax=Roseivirga sp. E12 TaxID=2819237 RepID=UPI001ABBFE47|nr:CAP domain-containing protein [Roseivirga sp. E12]MBO3699532.1 CAP domain-containing protein [Roseivirga sp. E12]